MTSRNATPRAPLWQRHSTSVVIWLMAATYLAAHVPFLPPSPYDIDGVNFALALHEYDLEKHQPHPPGSPLFIGLGRIARTTLTWANELESPTRAVDAAALAMWSAFFGALAAFGLVRLFSALDQSPFRAVVATAVTLASPLFWCSGVRPMSDLPGLALGALALGFIAPSLRRRDSDAHSEYRSSAALAIGCFFASMAPGMRLPMMWLTWPTTAAAITLVMRRAHRRSAVLAAGSFLLGIVAWLLPLSVITGGPLEYVRMLRLQAAEDVVAGQMLALHFNARAAAQPLQDTLITPWGVPWLGWIALAAAVAGAVRLLVLQTGVVVKLALIFGPYGVLHLAFQDTVYVRYALPLVPLIGMLATNGFQVFGRSVGTAMTIGLVAVSLALATNAIVPQSRAPAPVYQALDDVRNQLTTAGERPVLAMHHAVQQALRGEPLPMQVLPSPLRYEWLELARYWRAGGQAPVWFLANRFRTDLALVDPASRSLVRSYRSPAPSRALLAGSRPRGVDWVEIDPPGWIALEGWSLTPEVRGVTIREYSRNRPLHTRALLRRRSDEAAIVLGGRNLGAHAPEGLSCPYASMDATSNSLR